MNEVYEVPTDAVATISRDNAMMIPTAIVRDPVVVLDEARTAAKALKDVISKKAKPVFFNGEQYLEYEDWQTVSRFYGCVARVRSTQYVAYGDVYGFEAHAEVVDIRTGEVVSSAEAMCLSDEEKWSGRPKYEYLYKTKSGRLVKDDPGKDEIVWEPNPAKPGSNRPAKERVMTGIEKVPMFQLRSMAQTRACAKALRNVFAWVVVLAGYRPTPAEELPEHDVKPAAATPAQQYAPTPAAPAPAAPAPAPAHPAPQYTGAPTNGGNGGAYPDRANDDRPISDKQMNRLFVIARQNGWSDDDVREIVHKSGYEKPSMIQRKDYDAIVDAVSNPRS